MTQAEYDEFRRRVETGELKAVSEHPSEEEIRYFASFAEQFDPCLPMDEIRRRGKEIDCGG